MQEARPPITFDKEYMQISTRKKYKYTGACVDVNTIEVILEDENGVAKYIDYVMFYLEFVEL